jgi:DNA-binding Xre family transcriptional regulator
LKINGILAATPKRKSSTACRKKDFEKLAAVTIREARKYRQRELARVSGFSPRHVSRLLSGKVAATPQSIARLQAAITAETLSRAKQTIQKGKISLRKFSTQAGIDPANLHTALAGKRPVSVETPKTPISIDENRQLNIPPS